MNAPNSVKDVSIREDFLRGYCARLADMHKALCELGVRIDPAFRGPAMHKRADLLSDLAESTEAMQLTVEALVKAADAYRVGVDGELERADRALRLAKAVRNGAVICGDCGGTGKVQDGSGKACARCTGDGVEAAAGGRR